MKNLNALIYDLGGPALVRFETPSEEETNNFNAVVLRWIRRLRATNLGFVFCQELNAHLQGSNESHVHTKELNSKMPTPLWNVKEIMKICINCLRHELKPT